MTKKNNHSLTWSSALFPSTADNVPLCFSGSGSGEKEDAETSFATGIVGLVVVVVVVAAGVEMGREVEGDGLVVVLGASSSQT